MLLMLQKRYGMKKKMYGKAISMKLRNEYIDEQEVRKCYDICL